MAGTRGAAGFILAFFLWGSVYAAQVEEIPPRWRALLKAIVEVNSGTGNIPGQEEIRRILIPEFESLGYRATTYSVGDGHKVAAFDFPGSRPKLLLVGHIDTVFPRESEFRIFSSTQDAWMGPGVIDMKGGIVLMLNALADLKDKGQLKRIRIVLNDDEETGSEHSTAKLGELAQGIAYGLVFEPGLEDGALVTAHSGAYWLELRVRGKAAHAGLEPEKGINACVELAREITEINALSDFSRSLTVNVGTIQGGIKPNVVCADARARIDIRHVNAEDLTDVLKKIDRIARSVTVRSRLTGEGTTTEIAMLSHDPSMPEKFTRGLFQLAQEAGAKAGLRVTGRRVGYASDANNLALPGVSLLVGLGPYGAGMHTDKERMLKRSYPERLKLVEGLIKKILSLSVPNFQSGDGFVKGQ